MGCNYKKGCSDIRTIKGDTGEQGEQGVAGINGVNGLNGVQLPEFVVKLGSSTLIQQVGIISAGTQFPLSNYIIPVGEDGVYEVYVEGQFEQGLDNTNYLLKLEIRKNGSLISPVNHNLIFWPQIVDIGKKFQLPYSAKQMNISCIAGDVLDIGIDINNAIGKISIQSYYIIKRS